MLDYIAHVVFSDVKVSETITRIKVARHAAGAASPLVVESALG